MLKVIAFTGKKGSGKNTMGAFLTGYQMKSCDLIEDFSIDDQARLIIEFKDEEGKDTSGVIDFSRQDPEFQMNVSRTIWPFVKMYAFAEPLKEMCIGLFDLKKELVYGSDEDKNTLVEHMLWENMPGVITPSQFSYFTNGVRTPMNDAKPTWTMLLDPAGPKNGKWTSAIDDLGIMVHEPGPMTIREILQFMGTEVMKKIWAPVWVRQLTNSVKDERSVISIITDLRFDDEYDGLKSLEQDGFEVKVVQLTRQRSEDSHKSEAGLSAGKEVFVLDNANMDALTSCQKLLEEMEKWGWMA